MRITDRKPSLFGFFSGFLFLLALVESWRIAEVHPGFLFEAQGREYLRRFVVGMFPPDLSWEFLTSMWKPTLETVQISLMGTFIAVLIGFPLAILGTSNLMVWGILNEAEKGAFSFRRTMRKVIYYTARWLLSLFRSIPEFVWAIVFVRAVGLGPFPGVLAIGVAYGGMLGKVYSEHFEAVNERPIESLQSTGAGRLQIFFYGIFPQVVPNFVSYTLYRWECAVRTSAILGLVGAGGLGQQIEISMRMFDFHQVLTLLGVLFFMVVFVDFFSARIRSLL